MLKFGRVVLAYMQFVDTPEIKKRPALVLFEGHGNVVLAGITSNLKMKGIPISKKEGAIKDSVIKINYIFTVSENMVIKQLFEISLEKKKKIISEINKLLAS